MQRLVAALAVLSFVTASFAPFAYADTSLNQVFGQLEQEYRLPSGVIAKIANVESGGNPTAGTPSGPYGMFQWYARYWVPASQAAYGRAVDPSLRADPTVSAKVTAAALADARYRNGALIQQAQLDMTLGLYLNHFLGINGAAKFIQLYQQNPNQPAAPYFPKEAANNQGIFNGRSFAGIVNYFASKLKVAGPSVSVAGNFQDANGISYAYSNADVTSNNFLPAGYVNNSGPNPWTYPTAYNYSGTQTTGLTAPTTVNQSASLGTPTGVGAGQIMSQNYYCMTSINPVVVQPVQAGTAFPSNCYNSPAMQQTQLSPMLQQQMSPTVAPGATTQLNGQTSITNVLGGASSYGTTTSGTSYATTQPLAFILVQPSIVSAGRSVVVSWTSVGMSTQSPCQLTGSTSTLAQANEGSMPIIVPATAQSGQQLPFSLSCTTQSGNSFNTSAAATVR